MQFEEVVRSRRSIRGYLDKPVPKALVRRDSRDRDARADFS